MVFANRREAGQVLAELLATRQLQNPVVLALPRGGVPVGAEVARLLGVPLEVIIARKIGAPIQPELAIGAVAESGASYFDREMAAEVGVSPARMEELAEREVAEMQRRVQIYRHGRPLPPLRDRQVVLVDDGVATGSTLRAAVRAVREQRPRRLIVAVPVGARDTLDELAAEVDEVVCPLPRDDLMAIGRWYADFRQLTDADVLRSLASVEKPPARERPNAEGGSVPVRGSHEVRVPAGGVTLEGTLSVPERPIGVVLFAHGSGSSRHSPRNRFVARTLEREGIATLLFDLLTADEERVDEKTGELRFDIDLLASRLTDATVWVREQPGFASLPFGYFGASTGAAAALVAAAKRPGAAAIVSRGGRPDLAASHLDRVRAPTLLIVGGEDSVVLPLNRAAWDLLPGEKLLEVVPGATHLFEEAGALEEVAALAANWFRLHFPKPAEAHP